MGGAAGGGGAVNRASLMTHPHSRDKGNKNI